MQLPAKTTIRNAARRALTLVLAAAFTFGMVQLLRLPQLTVSATSTHIGGVERTTRDQIYKASGLEGRNILLVRPAEVATAINKVEGIVSVQVHVRLPNRVLIDVQEYMPLVAWQGIATTVWLAADGTPVPQTGQVPPLTLKYQAEELSDAGSPLARILLDNLAALHSARPEITEVYYNKNLGLSFRTREGWEVWLGDSGPLNDKLALLDVARQEITKLGRQARVIDLRYSNQRVIWW